MDGKILITGAGGQLGRAVAARLGATGDVVALTRQDLDITDPARLEATLGRVRPRWVINCAAWTAVDLAEEDSAGAYRLNDGAAGQVADAAARVGATVVHFSTDYVFDGRSSRPYVETDEPAPINVYGASKLAGERRLLEHGVPVAILRTSWLYGDAGKNFFRTMLELGARNAGSGRPLPVVDDQVGTPTDVHSLAAQVEVVLAEGLSGLFHASSQGQASWCEFARAILGGAGLDVTVEPVDSDAFPCPAARPAYSVLENRRLGELGVDRMPDWRAGLESVLERWRTGSR